MPQEDSLQALVRPLNDQMIDVLAAYQWPPKLVGAVAGLTQVAEMAVLTAGVALVCAALHAAAGKVGVTPRRYGAGAAIFLGAAGVAAVVFYWSVRVPSADISSLFGRWDHLVFCGFAG